jgi:hypothetical protein
MNKNTHTQNSQFKHGDKIIATVSCCGKDETYTGHIEERMLDQWPVERFALFVVIDDETPRFPIEVNSFLENYGTVCIKSINDLV